VTDTLIWDFDGTLGYREGGMWSATVLEILQAQYPGCPYAIGDVRPHMATGFYWDRHEVPHPEIRDADAWWDGLRPRLAGAFRALGVPDGEVPRLVERVRPVYTDLRRWRLYPGTLEVLDRLSQEGWRHVILSNHVPELRDIVRQLGLLPRVAAFLNSAETGYEKPHPRAFRLAMQAVGDADNLWMIGDNPVADIAGAAQVGIPGILIGAEEDHRAVYTCQDLHEVARLLGRLGPVGA